LIAPPWQIQVKLEHPWRDAFTQGTKNEVTTEIFRNLEEGEEQRRKKRAVDETVNHIESRVSGMSPTSDSRMIHKLKQATQMLKIDTWYALWLLWCYYVLGILFAQLGK
jgi:hypothetical protein